MLCYQGKEGVFKMKFKPNIELKKWGSEETIVNNLLKNKSFKILKINFNKKTSWHYHLEKESYFYLMSGQVSIHMSDENSLNLANVVLLNEGDCLIIPKNKRHMITAIKESVLLECSNFDDCMDKITIHH